MASKSEEDRAPVENVLDAFERWILGHRHVVAPPLTAAAMWGSSGLAYALTGPVSPFGASPVDLGYWAFGVYALAVVSLVLVVGVDVVHHTERVPLLGDDKPGERRDESRLDTQRVSAFGWGYGAVWCLVQAWFGPSLASLGLLVLFLVPAWVAWYHSRRVQRGVEVFRLREKWDGDAVGLPGLDAAESDARAAADGSWWEWPLRSAVKGRYTASVIRKALPRIAARYEVTPAELVVDEPRPGRFVLRYTKADPNEAALRFEPPAEGYSIRHRARIGRWDDDNSPMLVSLYRDGHGAVDGLAIGQKGGGKSNYAEVLAAHVAAAKDAVLWVIDLKPGAPNWRPWAPVCDWFATTAEEADRMVLVLLGLQQVRGGDGGRVVKPSERRKGIVVLLDEGALWYNPALPPGDFKARQVLQARITAHENLLTTSRSSAISWRTMVQRAIWDNVGGSTIRGHLIGGEAAIFRTAKNEDARLAVDVPPDEADALQTSTIGRGRPGTCVILNAENEEARRGRVAELTEAERDRHVAAWAGRHGTLHDDEGRALAGMHTHDGVSLGDLYANRQRSLQGTTPAPFAPAVAEEVDDAPDVGPELAVGERLATEDDALVLAWRACAEDETRGRTVGEVAASCGKSESWARARLAQLERLGALRTEGRRPKRHLTLGAEPQLRDALAQDEPQDAAAEAH